MPLQQPQHVDANFYAVVLPECSRIHTDAQGRPILESAKVDRITRQRPQTVRGGGIVVRLTLRLDAAALLPLQPQAVIHVGPNQVDVVEAHAHDLEPTDDREPDQALHAPVQYPICLDHDEKQHRDGKPPWCNQCGWNRGDTGRPAAYLGKSRTPGAQQ